MPTITVFVRVTISANKEGETQKRKEVFKLLSNTVIEKLVAFGGNRWTAKNKDRIYFGTKALGIEYKVVEAWPELEGADMKEVNAWDNKAVTGAMRGRLQASKNWIEVPSGRCVTSDTKEEELILARLQYLLLKAETELTTATEEQVETKAEPIQDADIFEEDFEEEVQATEEEVVSLPNNLNAQQQKNLQQVCKNYSFLLQKAVGFTKLELSQDKIIFEGLDATNQAHQYLAYLIVNFASKATKVQDKVL